MDLLTITLLGLAAGVLGTGIGGILGVLATGVTNKKISFMLGFAAGVMISIVAVELIPEAMEMSSLDIVVAGFLVGCFVIAALDFFLPHVHIAGEDEVHIKLKRTGVVLAVGIALHNLPEGLAIGAGAVRDIEMGMLLALMIAIHNIPEGMAMSIPLKIAKTRYSRILFAAVCVGVPMGIGAFFGQLIGAVSDQLLAFALSFAGGAMFFIICDELIPESAKLSERHSSTYGIMTGFVLGLILIGLFH